MRALHVLKRSFFVIWPAGLLWVILSLAGCPTQSSASDQSYITPTIADWYIGVGVSEIHLKDGTRCAVLESTHGGGITCDWLHE